MVEASLVYPLIVIICVLMISVSAFLYSSAEALCCMDMMTRRTADEDTGTVKYRQCEQYREGDYEMSSRYDGLVKVSSMVRDSYYATRFIQDVRRKTEVQHNYVNECSVVNKFSFAEDVADYIVDE